MDFSKLSPWFMHIRTRPLLFTALISILLSCIAIAGVVTIGKDGALYIDTAQKITEYGPAVAFERFNWPWFSFLLSYSHQATGLAYETIAYLYSIFFMTGLCVTLVSVVKAKEPEAVWWAVLLVLSIPVFNSFRYEIIRDTGFWFFSVLSLRLAMQYNVSFLAGLGIQLCIALAALFRFEAAFLLPALFVYVVFFKPVESAKHRLAQVLSFFSLSMGLLFLLVIYFVVSGAALQERIQQQLAMINPLAIYESFKVKSEIIVAHGFAKWAVADAPVILLAGVFAAIIFRVLTYIGISSFLFASGNARSAFFKSFSNYKVFLVSAFFYFIILYVFFIQAGFTNSRYISLFVVLLVPCLAGMVFSYFKTKPKLLAAFVTVSILFSVANVVSTSVKKTHYLEAAKWIESNLSLDDKIYFEDYRISYYAGFGYSLEGGADFYEIINDESKPYSYYVFELKESQQLQDALNANNAQIVTSFTNGKKTILIIKRQ